MAYLKSRQRYVDRYDRMTVRECHWAENAIGEGTIKKYYKKGTDVKELARMAGAFNKLHLYFVQGELYQKKEETISQWMQEDEEKDRFYESTRPPDGVTCLTCGRDLMVIHKDLEDNLNKPLRVRFMFECSLGHLPRRAFYDDGEEWTYKPPLCPKCRSPLDVSDQDTEEMFKIVYTCSLCDHIEVSEIPRTADKEQDDPDYEKDRARFCNEEDGRKYIEWMNNAKELSKVLDKIEERKQNKELYDRVEKLKKLSIPQVKQFLVESLEDEPYTNLTFEPSSMDRIVSLGFSVEDPSDQGEYDSRTKLTRFLKKKLEGTNWRLMSDGITYRLGVLTGRVRVYEKEGELVKLVKNK